MIVFGVRNKILKSENIMGNCPICKESDCLQMTLYQPYGCLFWVPTFPAKKKESSVCRKCGAKLQLRYMSPAFNETFNRLKSESSTPIWTFTGSAIIVVGLVVGLFFYKIDANKTKLRVQAPQKGDIFEIRVKSGNYTLYKVIKANRDSVYFFANKYETDNGTNLDELYDNGDSGFETSTIYGIPISRFIKMDSDGDVFGFKGK